MQILQTLRRFAAANLGLHSLQTPLSWDKTPYAKERRGLLSLKFLTCCICIHSDNGSHLTDAEPVGESFLLKDSTLSGTVVLDFFLSQDPSVGLDKLTALK